MFYVGATMGLRDALSGRVLRWNSSKWEASRRSYAGRQAFSQQAMTELPDEAHRTLLRVRHWMLAFYISAGQGLSESLDSVLNRYKKELYELNWEGHRSLIATFHVSH